MTYIGISMSVSSNFCLYLALICLVRSGDVAGIAASTTLPAVDPEANMSYCEIANYHGYKCEEFYHQVETEDGFLLTLHRMPGKSCKGSCPPVLLWHGLLSDSTCWILNPPNESLAFQLVDSGYDVWAANSRGNTYSTAHKSLKPSQFKFWAWSWDEMAQYDVPATVDFVLNNTGYSQLHYIGHSQGTLIAFVHLSTTNNTKISHFIALAPIFHVSYIKSPIRLLSPFANEIAAVLELLGIKDLDPAPWVLNELADLLCEKDDPLRYICADGMFLVNGFDRKQLNLTRMPVYLSHDSAGTSFRNLLHFAQMCNSRNCSKFNYGSPLANLKHYGEVTPPAYDLQFPSDTSLSLFSGGNDWLADPQDVKYIAAKLPTVIRNNVYVEDYDHMDFLWAMNVRTKISNQVIKIIEHDFNEG